MTAGLDRLAKGACLAGPRRSERTGEIPSCPSWQMRKAPNRDEWVAMLEMHHVKA